MLQSPHAPSTAEEQPSSMEHEVPLHGRVLLAEDVPDIYVVLRQILQRMNLEVEIAEDGRLACEMAEKSQAEGRPYDLILMDIQMPKMNGYEATRWLRQHGWQGPIVALTAHALVGDREKCLAAGCDDYIAKPITATGLRDVLARYLGQAAAAGCRPAGNPGDCPRIHRTSRQRHSRSKQGGRAGGCVSRRVAPAGRTDRQGFSTARSHSAIRLGAPAQRERQASTASTAYPRLPDIICDRLRADDELKGTSSYRIRTGRSLQASRLGQATKTIGSAVRTSDLPAAITLVQRGPGR